jgi:hypothetical protein
MKLFGVIYTRIFQLLFVAVFFYCCQLAESDIIALDQLDRTFNVSKFYAPKIRKTKELFALDVKTMDRSTLKEAFGTPIFKKDTLAIFDTHGSLPTPFYLESTSGWETKKLKPQKYFGYRYTTLFHHEEKDTLAILNGVTFPALTMAESSAGKFAYLYATKTSKNRTDFAAISDFLQKTYKPVQLAADAGLGIRGWESKDFYYFLIKTDRREEQIFSFGEAEDNSPTIKNVSAILLEIVDKEYIRQMRQEKVYLPVYYPL